MDDMYQYASSAVNSNQPSNSNDRAEENDIVLQAFNNFGWSQRFNSLLDTVKKQSEVIVDVTRKDLEGFAHVLREDNATSTSTSGTTATRDMSSSDASSSTATISAEKPSTTEDNNDNTATTATTGFAALRESLNKISTIDFNSLREGLGNTLNQSLPAQLSSVRLPENLDINQLKAEMAQGTRFAEQYLLKFGTEVVDVLSKTITVLEPHSSDEEQGGRGSSESARRVYATRKESLLAKMRTNPNTYLQDPAKDLTGDEKKLKVLKTFNAGFSIDSYTEEIARLLDEYPEMREMMNDLVPVQIDYTSFWQRYFYQVWSIEQDEQKRQMIVKGVDDDDDDADFKWDSDDEDMMQQKTSSDVTKDKKTSTDGKGGSDTEFSNISEPVSTEPSLVSPPLKSQTDGDDWVKPDVAKSNKTDSDSDWE
ncbi:hypothetical protein BDC45DRAFT_507941 [Circinella umbellata]|nr:hypothetical protein BDC45DRAFT_507941 [Circinella umbellata]